MAVSQAVRIGDVLLAALYLVARIHVNPLPEAMEQSAILEVRLIVQRDWKRGPAEARD